MSRRDDPDIFKMTVTHPVTGQTISFEAEGAIMDDDHIFLDRHGGSFCFVTGKYAHLKVAKGKDVDAITDIDDGAYASRCSECKHLVYRRKPTC